MRQENECSVDSWSLIPFKSNIEMLSGFPFDSSLFNAGDGLPLIRIRNIISGKTETYFSGKYSDEYVIKEGDILVGMDGDFHIRKWKGTKALLNQRILKLYESPESQINLEFFYYLAQPFLLMVHQRTAGTTVKHLSTKDFRNASFRIPTYKEQQKIAEILSTIDEKIDTIDQKIKETEALKKGMMQRLLTKGIGHTQFKDSPLGEIPESWEVRILKDECDKINVGFVGTCEKYYCKKTDGVQMIRTGNLSNGKIKFKNLKYVTNEFHEKNVKSQIFEGDLLVARHGSSGQAVLVPQNFGKSNSLNIIIIRPKKGLNSEYLKFQFNSDIIKNQVRKKTAGSTQGVVNTKEIATLKILFAPISEQIEIADIFNLIDSKIELLTEKKVNYQKLKQGLMQKLLTGKIRVNSLIKSEATA